MLVRLHIMKPLVAGAKNRVIYGDPMNIELKRVPNEGEFFKGIEDGIVHQALFVVNCLDGSADVFAISAFPPADIAEAIGVEGGMPSLEGFDGKSVGELISFLAQFPSDYGVVFTDEGRLVAEAEDGYISLRIDDKDD